MQPIYSEFDGDVEWQELLHDFIDLVPQRINSIREAMTQLDAKRVRTVIHQMRGACGSYGFHTITKPAAALESAIEANASLEVHQAQIEVFIQLLQCISSSDKQSHDVMPAMGER